MTPPLSVGPPADQGEVDQLAAILAESFNAPHDDVRAGLDRTDLIGIRVVRQQSRVVGGCKLLPMGQWFGGCSVPTTGIAAVGVRPDARRLGAGLALMQHVVRELAAARAPLSCLYPATATLYRRAGYELAGSRFLNTLPLTGLDVDERGLELRAGDASDYPLMEDAYRRFVQQHNGPLDRGVLRWERARVCGSQSARHYLVLDGGELQAYASVVQEDGQDELPFYQLRLTDLVVLTPRAGRRLLSLLAASRSMAGQVRWFGSEADLLRALLPEPVGSVSLASHWMLRVCDPAAALSARGYPAGSGELQLRVVDNVVHENNAALVLTVKGGQATVEPGGRGELRVDVRGLAALYSSFRTPAQLATLGLLDGPAQARERATALFAGSSPWMGDMF